MSLRGLSLLHPRGIAEVVVAVVITIASVAAALADDAPSGIVRADGHAPIGVMGEHMHKKGEWMLSYRHMRMQMDGNQIGEDDVSADIIATTIPNRFAGPPTLRVVPTEMSMKMDMFGMMFAPSDNVTLMAMVNFVEKEMDHITYAGMAGTTVRGTFTARSRGLGDLPITALIRLYDDPIHHVHLNAGVSAPVGSITKVDQILAPNGMTPSLRLPYAMQLGSGTWDALPGITYTARAGNLSWGAQYKATLRMEDENDEGYRFGDIHQGTVWASYQWAPWISTSLRASARTEEEIHGIDSAIAVPNQTANPDFYGGERIDLHAGINLAGQSGLLRGHRLAVELGVPVYQDLNGPQMSTDWILTVGWQKAF